MEPACDLVAAGAAVPPEYADAVALHTVANPFAPGGLPGSAPWVVLLGGGVQPLPGFFGAMQAGVAAQPAAVAFALPVLPGYGDGYVDPVSLRAQGFCGPALVVRRHRTRRPISSRAARWPPAPRC